MVISRRSFLQNLLALGAVAATPKFIFDMGANLYKVAPISIMTEIDAAAILAEIEYWDAMQQMTQVDCSNIFKGLRVGMLIPNGAEYSVNKAPLSSLTLPKPYVPYPHEPVVLKDHHRHWLKF